MLNKLSNVSILSNIKILFKLLSFTNITHMILCAFRLHDLLDLSPLVLFLGCNEASSLCKYFRKSREFMEFQHCYCRYTDIKDTIFTFRTN